MVDNTNTQKNNFNEYDFLDFSFRSQDGLRYGMNLGGKKGISFEPDKKLFKELQDEFKEDKNMSRHKLLNQTPLKIIINNTNTKHFKFTTCLDMIECLEGIGETRTLIYNALKLSNQFVFISQPNYDSDVVLFKKGFKTYLSDWSRHTNHLTSNIFFNLLFDFYKKGYIEDFVIFYKDSINNSNDPIIHPLNSPKNQAVFNEDKHPTKNERIHFENVYRTLNILITISGFKKIDDIYNKIEGEKHMLYDSRQGIFDNTQEKFTEKSRKNKTSIFKKVNKILNSDV